MSARKLKNWKKGDKISSAEHLDEVVKWANDFPQWKDKDNFLGERLKIYQGIVMDAGTVGVSTIVDTRTDNTYWVKKLSNTVVAYAGSIGDGSHQKFTTEDNADQSETNDFMVLVTNLAEDVAGTHSISVGTKVTFYSISSFVNTNSQQQDLYWMDYGPQICYGKVNATWTTGNLVLVNRCKTSVDNTLIYSSYTTQMPDVTVRLYSPTGASPSNVHLSYGDIIAFYYEGDNTHGIAMPVDNSFIGGTTPSLQLYHDDCSAEFGVVASTDNDDGIINGIKLKSNCGPADTCPGNFRDVQWSVSVSAGIASLYGTVPPELPAKPGPGTYTLQLIVDEYGACTLSWEAVGDCPSSSSGG